MKSDSDIRCAVEAELSAHPLVDDTDIVVKVERGVVTLSGYVRNLFHKYGAEDAVKRVAGVVSVINTITLARPDASAIRVESRDFAGTGAPPGAAS